MARILIVDDSLMMRKILRKILVNAGHEVVSEAVNGEQALVSYPQCQPELVTMDITMPGLSGIETIKRILQFDQAAKIIVVSALGQKHIVFDALKSGAKNFIVKPLSEEKILPVINMVLEQSS